MSRRAIYVTAAALTSFALVTGGAVYFVGMSPGAGAPSTRPTTASTEADAPATDPPPVDEPTIDEAPSPNVAPRRERDDPERLEHRQARRGDGEHRRHGEEEDDDES